jgi:hypothetical protein
MEMSFRREQYSPVKLMALIICPIVFPLAIPDCLRIAAGYVDCKAEFLSQTDLRARSHERMSALSTAASRVPKSSVASPLASKRFIQWQITSAVVACLIFDVKAKTLIDAPRAWPDRGQSIRVITALRG